MTIMNARHIASSLLVFATAGATQLHPQAPEPEGVASVVRSAVDTVYASLSLAVRADQITLIDLSALPADINRRSVAERLSMAQARRADVFRCPPIEGRRHDRNCFIEGADYLITVHRFSISNQVATIDVEIQGEHETDDYRSVWSGGWRVAVERSGSGWSVTDLKELWEW